MILDPHHLVNPSIARDLGLTSRQAEVLALAAAGLSDDQIGQRLYITRDTVKQHVQRACRNVGVSVTTVSRRTAAVALAYELGLFRTPRERDALRARRRGAA